MTGMRYVDHDGVLVHGSDQVFAEESHPSIAQLTASTSIKIGKGVAQPNDPEPQTVHDADALKVLFDHVGSLGDHHDRNLATRARVAYLFRSRGQREDG